MAFENVGIVAGPVANVNYTHNVPEYALGTQVQFADGKTFRYVRTTRALSQGSVVAIGSDYTVGNDISSIQDSTNTPFAAGVSQQNTSAPASGYTYRYAWVQTAGAFTYLKLCGGTVKDNPLYISSLPGALNSLTLAGLSTLMMAVKYTGSSTVTGAGSTSSACFSNTELFVPRENS